MECDSIINKLSVICILILIASCLSVFASCVNGYIVDRIERKIDKFLNKFQISSSTDSEDE